MRTWLVGGTSPLICHIGGGPIGCELVQAFQRLGSQVTLLHTGSHLLNKEDADAVVRAQQRPARRLSGPTTLAFVAVPWAK